MKYEKLFIQNTLTDMNKHGNLTKLAELAGVSLTTASRALNNHPYVSEEIRKRVFETASQMNYFPPAAARKKRLGIVVSNPGNVRVNFYQSEMLSELARQSGERDISLEIISTADLELIEQNFLRAVIVFQETAVLDLKRCPNAAFIGINTALPGFPGIFSDDGKAIEEAVDYFYRNGIRMPALVLPQNKKTGHIAFRRQKFTACCRQHGHPDPEPCVICLDEEPEHHLSRLRLEKKIDALLIPGEDMAPRVNFMIKSLDLRVPEDLSIITWESAGISEFMFPPHTTFAQNYAELVRCALDRAEPVLQGKKLSREPGEVIPYIFNERKSVKK